jgi:hypothetical protein
VIVVGGVGLFFGVIADEAVPVLDVPTSFVAVVAKVYATPSLNPVNVQDVPGGVIKHVNPPGEDVTV